MWLDLGYLVILAAWSAGVGLWLMRRFGPRPEHPADALALAWPLGLGALGLATLALGMIGALGTSGLRVVGIAGVLIGSPSLIRWAAEALRASPQRPAFETPDRVLGACLGIAMAGTLLTAMAPVTDGDALCYHLEVPRRFLERGGTFFDPDLHETVYPLLTEMLYAVGLAARGPVACRLTQWLIGLVFALNVNALARPFLGARAWWAGGIALLVPAVSNGMSAPLNDVALAAFGTAALFAAARLRERPTFRGAALAGVMVGLAMGVKYPALVLGGLIGLWVAPSFVSRTFFRLSTIGAAGLPIFGTRFARRATGIALDHWAEEDAIPVARPRRRWSHAVAFGVAAWAIGGIWYARASWHTGNPVHPFFRQVFGGAGLDEVLAPEKRPLSVTPWNLLTALGPMTLEPDRFDSFSHQFGPVFLLFLPALLWERPPRRLLMLVLIGYAFLAACLTQRQSMRFVLAALGPFCVAVAWLAQAWWSRQSRPGRILVGTLLVALAFQSAIAAARARHGWKAAVGLESVEAYLARREPTYLVGRWIEDHLPREARIVGQDHRGFYIPRPYTMELAHRRRTGVGRAGQSADAIVATLASEGFTHLLFCPPVPETAVEFDPTLGRSLAPWLEGRSPIYRDDLTDGDGVVRRYALYELTPPSKPAAVVATEGRVQR